MRRCVGRIAAATIGLALTLTTGCKGFFVYPGSSNGSTGSTSGDYVYVASANLNALSYTLAGFALGSGTLTAVPNSPYALNFAPTAVVVNPADTIVFVGGSSSIYAFSIGSGGALSILNGGSAVGAANVVSMDISPDGNWLVVLDGTASFSGEVTIDVFQINLTTGVLTQQFPNTYYSFGSNQIVPRAIKFSPNEASIGVAVGTSGDLVYTFTASSSSGLLSAALSSPQLISAPATPMSDNGLAWGPNNATLYITRSNSTSNGVVAQYTLTGGLLNTAYTTYPTGVQPTSVAVNTAGTNEYVYVANQSVQGSISGYSVASDGVLTALAALPYTAGSYVAALAVDSTGDYLLAAALGGSPDLELFSFASGQLAPSATASTGGGTEPAGAVAVATTH